MTNHQEAIAIHRQEQDMEDDFHYCYYEEDGIKCIADAEPDNQCENCGSYFCERHGDRNCRLNAGEYVSTCEACYSNYFGPAMTKYRQATGMRR